jgi:hypothetical protein
MENLFDILKAYHDLDTSLKKEIFIENGLHSKGWKEISFHAIVEDLSSTNIFAYPVSSKDEKLDQMVFIKYYRKDFIQLKKFPIAKKGDVVKIAKLNRFDQIKGVAIIEEVSPIIYLKLIQLE